MKILPNLINCQTCKLEASVYRFGTNCARCYDGRIKLYKEGIDRKILEGPTWNNGLK